MDVRELRSGGGQATIGVRICALAAAAFWAVLYFGLIDLLIDYSRVVEESLEKGVYLLAIGWGLLYTVLVPGPLVLFALLGRGRVFLQQLLVISIGIMLCAVLSLAVAQLGPGVILLGMTAGLAAASGVGLRMPGEWSIRRVDWLLGVLALTAVAAGIVYAAQMIRAIGEAADDVTWGLDHLPMQAAFGVALAGSAAVSTLAGGAGERGWRAASIMPGLAAAWFGLASVLHLGQVGGWGTLGGWAAVVWGVLFIAASATRRRPAVMSGFATEQSLP